ncbi:CASP-like protein [Quillaja saponaria]|uniref:CASP-like protein n=1 Tax=Quillaja saponaria TaxID=32244 RepID=A0AAD7LEJ0_QUISA|nr:CASP-like protein [Quillaja saponaria]
MEVQSRNHRTKTMKKSSSRNSECESFYSPRRFNSPLRLEQGDQPETPPYASLESSPEKQLDNSKAIIAVEKFTRNLPVRSPLPPNEYHKTPESVPPAMSPVSVVSFNRSTREEPPPSVTKVGLAGGGVGGVGGDRDGRLGRSRPMASMVGSARKEEMVSKAALGFRVSELVLCLISFSVMAADKTRGWSGDSFDRYKEYRYCLSVNIIGFVYSGFQAFDLAYHLVSGHHHRRYHFDFFMDQILAYLLISASSSAATRVDDWQSNWGKDEFTEMASASVGMAFLAFIAFAFSSLISGYNLCTRSF